MTDPLKVEEQSNYQQNLVTIFNAPLQPYNLKAIVWVLEACGNQEKSNIISFCYKSGVWSIFKILKSGKNLCFNCIINSIRKDGWKKNHMMCENMKNQLGIMKKNVVKGRKVLLLKNHLTYKLN